MNLTIEEKWMISYLNDRIDRWGDVPHGAVRAMKKINVREDLKDWTDYFLPKARKQELQKALSAYKSTKANKSGVAINETTDVQLRLNSKAGKVIAARAKKEGISPSELIIKYLS